MKKLLLLTLTNIVAANLSFAKVTGASVSGLYPHFNSDGNSTTAIIAYSRLVSKSYYVHNGSALLPVDSTRYIYTSGRSGNPEIMDKNDDNVFFDSSYSFSFNSSAKSFQNTFRRIQQYDVRNRISVLSHQPKGASNNTWKDSVRYLYNFNSNGELSRMDLNIWYANGWHNNVQYVNSFDANNNIVLMHSPTYDMYFTYNSNNDLIVSKDAYSSPSQLSQYDKLDSFIYDAQHRVAAQVTQRWDAFSSTWKNSERWEFDYVSAGNDVATAILKEWSNNSWVNKEFHTYTYDAQHNKLSDINQEWNSGSFVNASRIEWTYNSSNQPLSITTNSWNVANSTWSFAAYDYQKNFYYESYTPTAVADINVSNLNISVYPSPASESVNLKLNWIKPQAFNVVVFDLQGRPLMQWNEKATNIYTKQIPVSNLASGNYFVKIIGADNSQTTYPFVVAH